MFAAAQILTTRGTHRVLRKAFQCLLAAVMLENIQTSNQIQKVGVNARNVQS